MSLIWYHFYFSAVALRDTNLAETEMPLDYFYTHSDTEWRSRKIMIGRRSGLFEIVAKKELSHHYDAGIAIDDVSFHSCFLPRPTIDSECPANHWRCTNNVCITLDRLCDLSDDCGDNSDEGIAVCEARTDGDETYFMETFEEGPYNFFINDEAGNSGSTWLWGSGSELFKGRSPPFDHTLLTDKGHYLRLDLNSGQANNQMAIATLLGQTMMKPQNAQDECRIRFYLHFMQDLGVIDARIFLAAK